ncbi:phage major capsid protein [Escherichia coli]
MKMTRPVRLANFSTSLPVRLTGVTADAIIKLIYTLRKAHRSGAKFMMNNSSLFAIRLLKDNDKICGVRALA